RRGRRLSRSISILAICADPCQNRGLFEGYPVGGGSSGQNPRTSLRATVALVAAFFILFIGLTALSLYQSRLEAEANAENRAAAATQVVATNTKWIVELSHQALQRIDDALGPRLESVHSHTIQDIAEAVDALQRL